MRDINKKIIKPVVEAIKNLDKKELGYSALSAVSTYLVYNTMNSIPFIGAQLAFWSTIAVGALMPKIKDEKWYKKFSQESTILSSTIQGLYAVGCGVALSQTDNVVVIGLGIATQALMNPLVTKAVETKIYNIGYAISHLAR